jgi:NTE family protein
MNADVADHWIGHHFDAIGQRSTIDVKEMFL